MGEKQEVKGARVYPPAERNHLWCAPAVWDHISALVFQHLLLKNNTYLNEEHRWSWVPPPFDECAFMHHTVSHACPLSGGDHMAHTDVVADRMGVFLNDPSVEAVRLCIKQPDRHGRCKQMNNSGTVKGAWKSCSLASIHPRQAVSPPGCPPARHTHAHIRIWQSHVWSQHPCSPSRRIFQLDTSCWHFHRH